MSDKQSAVLLVHLMRQIEMIERPMSIEALKGDATPPYVHKACRDLNRLADSLQNQINDLAGATWVV